MNKVYPDAASALEGLLFDNMTVMAGGFGLCGIPEHLDRRCARFRCKGFNRHQQ